MVQATAFLTRIRDSTSASNVVLAGDFNPFEPQKMHGFRSSLQATLDCKVVAALEVGTTTTNEMNSKSQVQLDAVFVGGETRKVDCEVIEHSTDIWGFDVMNPSDHKPLLCTIEL